MCVRFSPALCSQSCAFFAFRVLTLTRRSPLLSTPTMSHQTMLDAPTRWCADPRMTCSTRLPIDANATRHQCEMHHTLLCAPTRHPVGGYFFAEYMYAGCVIRYPSPPLRWAVSACLYCLNSLTHLPPFPSAPHPRARPNSGAQINAPRAQPDAQRDANTPFTKVRHRAPTRAVPPSACSSAPSRPWCFLL